MRPPAPPPLELVEAFVNSADLETGEDAWRTSAGLKAWLLGRRLIPAGGTVGEDDRRRAIRLREGLRIAAAANNGGTMPARARRVLNEIGEQLPLHVTVPTRGSAALQPAGGGVDAALARVLASFYQSMLAGSWPRLKACANPECRFAFYDASKNRSGRWCEMADCGNEAKARTFRERHG